MQKYIFDFNYKKENTAGSKAKKDVLFFLRQEGFKLVSYPIYSNRIIRGITSKILAKRIISKLNVGEIVFQYPLYHKRISNYIVTELEKKDILKVVLIHDIESLRLDSKNKNAVKDEISFLNRFDVVISHNKKMTNWLVGHGLKAKTKELEIFDYMNPKSLSEKKLNDGIVFAGNLLKSTFLKDLDVRTKVELMGPNPLKNYPKNFVYKGVFDPDEVPEHLNMKFGLVWDGSSIDTCNGLYGHYMKYNNPHKASLYISSGIPLIIWNEAAIADFIKKEGIGLTIGSLKEVDDLLANITEEEYEKMKKNTLKVAKKMRSGFYIKTAVDRLEN